MQGLFAHTRPSPQNSNPVSTNHDLLALHLRAATRPLDNSCEVRDGCLLLRVRRSAGRSEVVAEVGSGRREDVVEAAADQSLPGFARYRLCLLACVRAGRQARACMRARVRAWGGYRMTVLHRCDMDRHKSVFYALLLKVQHLSKAPHLLYRPHSVPTGSALSFRSAGPVFFASNTRPHMCSQGTGVCPRHGCKCIAKTPLV